MTTIRSRRLILYVACVFIVARVAANIGSEPREKEMHVSDVFARDPKLEKMILAFKKGGIEREVDTDNYDIEGIIAYAESLLGVPHVMGGYSTSGLDCSGLVKLAHARFDVDLPHSSNEQGRYGTLVEPGEELERGDLVFFHSTYATPKLITHSGIYLGENKFIHTSSSRGVSISILLDSGYWQDHYLFATRLND